MTSFRLLHGDCRELLKTLPEASVQCCVTSPPYWGLRDYGVDAQIGLERTPESYVAALVEVFREVRRVLASDGVAWLNLGDTYAGARGQASRGGPPSASSTLEGNGHRGGGPKLKSMTMSRRRDDVEIPRSDVRVEGLKPKDLVGIPWWVAFALQADGWWLRSDVIWSKPNPMPESVIDRPTRSHEYLFLLSKSERYYYNKDAICEPYQDATLKRGKSIRQVAADGHKTYRFNGEPLDAESVARGRNARSVWHMPTQPYRGAHFAVMPEALAKPCILAGSRAGDVVLDPFSGMATTGVVAAKHGRHYIGIDANADYLALSASRIKAVSPLFVEEAVS